MTPEQSAQVLAAIHGAYPRVEMDEAMVMVWQNALAVADYDDAMNAVAQWTGTQKWAPSIAELNGLMTSMRQEAARSGDTRALPRSSGRRFGCDGTGWLDRGEGLEPCPSCNPWGEMLWENGDWQNLRVQAPRDWVQPMACHPIHTESELFSFDQARAAIERGYREHWDYVNPVDEGWSVEEIEEREERISAKLAKLFRAGSPTVGGR